MLERHIYRIYCSYCCVKLRKSQRWCSAVLQLNSSDREGKKKNLTESDFPLNGEISGWCAVSWAVKRGKPSEDDQRGVHNWGMTNYSGNSNISHWSHFIVVTVKPTLWKNCCFFFSLGPLQFQCGPNFQSEHYSRVSTSSDMSLRAAQHIWEIPNNLRNGQKQCYSGKLYWHNRARNYIEQAANHLPKIKHYLLLDPISSRSSCQDWVNRQSNTDPCPPSCLVTPWSLVSTRQMCWCWYVTCCIPWSLFSRVIQDGPAKLHQVRVLY